MYNGQCIPAINTSLGNKKETPVDIRKILINKMGWMVSALVVCSF